MPSKAKIGRGEREKEEQGNWAARCIGLLFVYPLLPYSRGAVGGMLIRVLPRAAWLLAVMATGGPRYRDKDTGDRAGTKTSTADDAELGCVACCWPCCVRGRGERCVVHGRGVLPVHVLRTMPHNTHTHTRARARTHTHTHTHTHTYTHTHTHTLARTHIKARAKPTRARRGQTQHGPGCCLRCFCFIPAAGLSANATSGRCSRSARSGR